MTTKTMTTMLVSSPTREEDVRSRLSARPLGQLDAAQLELGAHLVLARLLLEALELGALFTLVLLACRLPLQPVLVAVPPASVLELRVLLVEPLYDPLLDRDRDATVLALRSADDCVLRKSQDELLVPKVVEVLDEHLAEAVAQPPRGVIVRTVAEVADGPLVVEATRLLDNELRPVEQLVDLQQTVHTVRRTDAHPLQTNGQLVVPVQAVVPHHHTIHDQRPNPRTNRQFHSVLPS